MNYREPDWKLIDEISLTLLEEGVGIYDVLQRALPSIVLCKIERTDDDCTVKRLLKMFRIAQMQIEYILKTQFELLQQVQDLQNSMKVVTEENSKLRKKLISEPETINSLFECSCCEKLFLHSCFLYDHMKRKHKNEQYSDDE
ncbi:unnamed protein product [Thelazia callipaeda]|uniref:C2H2-type domain-containing protein n=1 Tax=Thelazia callipaeda TaxID=103827 RepID=A0A0N5D132_THECL|nr:unnamed protein product [Thelazia callipaeda]